MNKMMKYLPPFLLSLGAAICFCLTIYFCLRGEIKAALLMSGLFFLCILLAYFPQIESLKAFAIDVKLRKNLDRAEEILKRVRQLTIFNAKISYMVLAWQNRMGSPSAKSKQEMLDEVDQMLVGLDIQDSQRTQMVQPYVRLIALDLWHTYEQIIREYVMWKKDRIADEDRDILKAKREEFCEKEIVWSQSRKREMPLDVEEIDFDEYLQRSIPIAIFSEEESEIANTFRTKVLDLYNLSKDKGGLVADAADFLDEMRSEEAKKHKMRKLFKID